MDFALFSGKTVDYARFVFVVVFDDRGKNTVEHRTPDFKRRSMEAVRGTADFKIDDY